MNHAESRLFALIDKLEKLQASIDTSNLSIDDVSAICEVIDGVFAYLEAGLLFADELNNTEELQEFLQQFSHASRIFNAVKHLHERFVQFARKRMQDLDVNISRQGQLDQAISELERLNLVCGTTQEQ